ncbi:glycosyltransferase 87 family protein [Streptomyces maoxianensis]|uniref:Glycosyltransferase 87 family protein n=1 Tax=Streptomyces maoxianensis TaxID=1459942 RepID=A0ABV9G786_9ACTN
MTQQKTGTLGSASAPEHSQDTADPRRHDSSPGSPGSAGSPGSPGSPGGTARALARAARYADAWTAKKSIVALYAVWSLTRLGMLFLLVQDSIGVSNVSDEVNFLYPRWYQQLTDGSFPVNDVTWQYPPGAGLVFLFPSTLPFLDYFKAFLVLTLLADAIVTLALARQGRSLAGAWMWTGGLPLLLNVPHGRFDIQVTALAVLALLSARRHPRLGGVFAALGAMIKVWPLLTLVGTERGRTSRQAWLSAAAAAGALLAVLALGFRHSLDFLQQQGARGVQIESLGGTVLSLMRASGMPIWVESRYGALEFSGAHVATVAQLSMLLTAAAFGWLMFWRGRAAQWTTATPFDAALAAVLLFTVTSRVISPQYLVWLLGLAAVCLTSRHTTQRPVALVLLAASAVTALAFPTYYLDVMYGSALGITLMVVRNGLLVTAALLSCQRLWKATAATTHTASTVPTAAP